LAKKTFLINDKLNIGMNASLDLLNNTNGYGLSSNYKFDKNISASFSYESSGLARFSLDWMIGENTQLKTSIDKESQAIGIQHSINDNRSIESQYYGKNTSFAINDNSSIFDSRIKLDKNQNDSARIKLRTNFAVVASDNSISLSKTIGNSGFVIFGAGNGLENKIIANIGDSECEVKKILFA
jgi:hypothetical protein